MAKLFKLFFFWSCLIGSVIDNVEPLLSLPVLTVVNCANIPDDFEHSAKNLIKIIEQSDLTVASKHSLKVCIQLVRHGYQPLAGETFEQSVKRIYKLRSVQSNEIVARAANCVDHNLPLIEYIGLIDEICGAKIGLTDYMHSRESSCNEDDADSSSKVTDDCCCCLWFRKAQ